MPNLQVKLNPDWSVPGKIAAIDMLKHELEEPGYFAEKNVRVYTTDGKLVDPTRVNWREVKASGKFPYRLKQDAGPENALGPMKLDFQNDYAVFVHGTSTPQLFVKQDRFFSSGCVRVEDPLQRAVDAMVANFLHDPWLVRRLRPIVRSMGFAVTSVRSHGYTQTTDPQYMLTIIDRGADVLAGAGSIGADEAEALKGEARRRAKAGTFFGHISYIGLIARKPN